DIRSVDGSRGHASGGVRRGSQRTSRRSQRRPSAGYWIERHFPGGRPLHDRRLAGRRVSLSGPDDERSERRLRRRIYLRLQRLPRALNIIKAPAYGNDFVLAAADLASGDLPTLARDICSRHTGIGADGLILYTLP